LTRSENPAVIRFLTRGEKTAGEPKEP